VLIALFSINAGQAVTFYAAQFYVLFFLTQFLKMDPAVANTLLIISVVIGAPFFIIFGWLSDKVGRKPILMLGLLLATALYFPIFKSLAHYANPAIDQASRQAPITVLADPATCTFQFDPVGKAKFDSPCDKVKTFLVKQGLPYSSVAAPAGSGVQVSVGDVKLDGFDEVRPARRDDPRRLSATGRYAADQQTDDRRLDRGADHHLGHVLRPARSADGRTVPDPHSLHLDVTAVPHRQRLVRRIPADRVVCFGGVHRGHFLRAVVPGADDRGEPGRRDDLFA
jgi:hypothetical protein